MRNPEPWGAGGIGPHAHGRGFTLIELLVCITIISMLIGMIVPGLRRTRAAARDAMCRSNLRQLSVCTQAYAGDYRSLPVWGTIGAVPMLELRRIEWTCPSDKLKPAYEQDSSYAYLGSLYMGDHPNLLIPATINARAALRAYENNPYLPLFWDFDNWHGHRNMAFWDGGTDRWRN